MSSTWLRPDASLRAHVLRIVAGVAGLLHEHGHLFLRGHLVEHVVEQAGEDPVAAVAVGDPEPAFGETEAMGQLHELGVGRDDVVERRIGLGDREGLGLGRRAVAPHLRRGRTALCLCVRGQGGDDGDRKGRGAKKSFHGEPPAGDLPYVSTRRVQQQARPTSAACRRSGDA